MKKLFYITLITAVALFGLTFSYQNHQTVEVDYYFGLHFEGPLPLLLFITFALGLGLGYGMALLNGLSTRRARRRRSNAAARNSHGSGTHAAPALPATRSSPLA